MSVRMLTLDAVSPRIWSAWRDLAANAAEPNPFHEPEAVLTAARHLDAPDTLRLAVVEADDQLLACLPVSSGRYWKRVPHRGVLAWRHQYCYLGTPLLRADALPEAAGGLLDVLTAHHRGRLLVLDRCHVEGPVFRALADAADARGTRVNADWCFERAIATSDSAAPIALRGKHLKDLRRQRRRMESALGAPLELIDREPDADTVGAFLKLESAGWKGAGGSALACADEGFFRTLCDSFSADHRLRFASLEAAGRPVAMLCTIEAGGESHWFKITFDEDLGEYSPGRQLMLDVTGRLGDSAPVRLLDSCANPQNDTINRMWSGRRKLATLLIALPGLTRRPVDILAATSSRRHEGRGEST